MYKPRLYPNVDLALAATLVDINPATGDETPLTGGTVAAFLATSPDATVAADPALQVAAVHLGAGEWLAHWDNSVLTSVLLAAEFGAAEPFAIFVHSGGVRAYVPLDYQTVKPALSVLGRLKAALRVRNTAEDDYIQELYDAAIATIERDTGEYYGEAKTVVETLRINTAIGWLLSTPVSITTVESLDESDEWSTVDVGDYENSGRRIRFLDTETWLYPSERRVTYVTGMRPDEIPAEVWLRITQLVALWFEQRLPSAALLEAQNAALGFVGSI